jgi:hypothetical protein
MKQTIFFFAWFLTITLIFTSNHKTTPITLKTLHGFDEIEDSEMTVYLNNEQMCLYFCIQLYAKLRDESYLTKEQRLMFAQVVKYARNNPKNLQLLNAENLHEYLDKRLYLYTLKHKNGPKYIENTHKYT